LHSTSYQGIAVDRKIIELFGETNDYPLQINNHHFLLSFYGLNDIKDDCILGSEFVKMMSPVTINAKEKKSVLHIKREQVETPLFNEGKMKSREKEEYEKK